MAKSLFSVFSLEKKLYQLYCANPKDYYGTQALSSVLLQADISAFTKDKLDVIFRFIDNPENVMNPVKADARKVAADWEDRLDNHFDNIVFLQENLSDFNTIDPKNAQKNMDKAALLAEKLREISFADMENEWGKAPHQDKMIMLRQCIEVLRKNTPTMVKISLDKYMNPDWHEAFYHEDTKTIFICAEENYLNSGTLIQMVALAMHELKHAEQYKKAETDTIMRRFINYYIEPTGFVFAHFGNYIEMDAYDIQDKLRVCLAQQRTLAQEKDNVPANFASLLLREQAKNMANKAYQR